MYCLQYQLKIDYGHIMFTPTHCLLSSPFPLRTELQWVVVEIPPMKSDNPSRLLDVISYHECFLCKQMQPDISNMPSSAVVIAEAILALLPCYLQCILWR